MFAPVINQKLQAEIIQSLVEKLRANYVFPDIAEQISRAAPETSG